MPEEELIVTSPMLRNLLTLVLLVAIGACSSSQHQGGETMADSSAAAVRKADTARGVDPRKAIGGKDCRIVGTIVAIDPTPHGNNPDHPTAKYPSVATVRVDSVLLTGSMFSHPPAAGDNVTVTFAYTLSPTKGLKLHIRQEYPGLTVGDRFRADIHERILPPDKAAVSFTTTPLVIFDYEAL
jgi:hypothetical protein